MVTGTQNTLGTPEVVDVAERSWKAYINTSNITSKQWEVLLISHVIFAIDFAVYAGMGSVHLYTYSTIDLDSDHLKQ